MARTKPLIEAPKSLEPRKDNEMITQVREYKLITPLFGGGVEPGEADPVTVIRASEIRGHLRFWWRATRGGQFGGNLGKMKAAEDTLWGAASKKDHERPSLVQVEVDVTNSGRPEIVYAVNRLTQRGQPVADHQRKSQTPPYVSFPLQPRREETEIGWKSKPVLLGVEFVVTLRFPAKTTHDGKEWRIVSEIDATCTAWESFGGVGGRTRRGFGALQLAQLDGKSVQNSFLSKRQDCIPQMQEILNNFTGEWGDDVPHLSPNTLFNVTEGTNSAIDTWNKLIDAFKNFRDQKDEIPYRKRDVDAIKRLVGPNPASEHIRNFQRATLGLPLIYQNLKGVYSANQRLQSVTLQGKSKDQSRFASPLILRPIACKDGKYVGLALLLEGTALPSELTLDGFDVTIDAGDADAIGVAEAFIKSI